MALTRARWRSAAATAALGVAFLAGCAATAAPKPTRPDSAAATPASSAPDPGASRKELAKLERDCPDARGYVYDGKHSTWWETFRRTNDSLRREIDRRAEALRSGPIGNRGRELASLRLAAAAHDSLEAGSKDGAWEALQQAVSLDARNGYALLLLAYLTNGPEAGALADRAERTLPRDPGVRCELEGLRWDLRSSVCTGYGGDDAHSRN